MRTIYPARFQQEPLDVRAFDAWQDAEGLVDASDECREEWGSFAEAWRQARRAELSPVGVVAARGGDELPGGLWWRSVRALNARARGKSPDAALGPCEMAAARAVKARLVGAGHWDIWHALVDMACGLSLGLACERQAVEARAMQAVVPLVMRWHVSELQVANGFWGPMQPDCGEGGSKNSIG